MMRRGESIASALATNSRLSAGRPTRFSSCVSTSVSNDCKREVNAAPRSQIFREPISRKVGSDPGKAARRRYGWNLDSNGAGGEDNDTADTVSFDGSFLTSMLANGFAGANHYSFQPAPPSGNASIFDHSTAAILHRSQRTS